MQRIYVTIRPLNREDSVLYFPPEAFGPFRVLHQIGAGTLGPVFRAYEPAGQRRDRLVAVKVFRLDLTPEQAAALVTELEALVAADITHPNIAAPIAAGLEHGTVYLAQEYAVGESLDEVLRERTTPAGDLVARVESLRDAIDFAASRGVHHGMLHPRDIIVAPDTARITGFGIAGALAKVGATLPTRAVNAAPDGEALRAIVSAIGAIGATGATGAAGATGVKPAPLAPLAPEPDFDLRLDEPPDLVLRLTPPPRVHATDVEPEPAGGRWPIVAMFLIFAVLTALSVGFFLESPTPEPVVEKAPAVEETIVDLPASAPAPVAPAAPSASASAPTEPAELRRDRPSAPSPTPSRPASGAVRRTQTGSVLVRSTPADADVLVNGKPSGKTPLALRDLALGSYTIRVTRNGYVAEERTVQLSARRPSTSATINLREAARPANRVAPGLPAKAMGDASATAGGLNVQSRPAGARVFVNDRLAGSTPIAIPGLPAGDATVRIEKDGYVPWTATVRVSAGEQTAVRASLEGK